MTMEDRLSREVSNARKNVNALARELDKARVEAERTGDYSNYDRLARELEQAESASVGLRRQLQLTRREIKETDRQTSTSAKKMGGAWSKLQGVFKNPLFTAATIAGVTLFGKRAVEAFAQAEQSQLKLVEAYRKFAAVGDVPIDSMRALASELQSLTGTDDDLLAAAAGTLARFELTGTAIQQLLPLVNDFAVLTGRDVVEASEAIGKAFMGNARALKELGIDFQRTGDTGKDFETILAALEAKAGGAGEAFGETAQGGLARAQAAFGDLQEEIGGTLVPALTAMLRVVEPAAKFFSGLPGPIKGTAIAIGILSAAVLAIGPRIATMVTGMKAAGIEATVMRGKMAAAGSFMAGPWGVAIAAATVVLGAFATAQADVTAKAESLVDTLDAMSGAATELTRQKLGEEFLKNFSITDLENTPFTLAEITSAVIEGGAAYENLRARVEEYSRQQLIASKGTDIFWLGALANSVDAMDRDYRATRALQESKEYAAAATEQAAEATDDLAMSQGRATNMTRDLSRILPTATYQASEYYQAIASSKRATDGLTQSLSDLSAAVNEWGSRDNFKASLKSFLEEPTADAARTMITNMEQAAASIEDPGERAAFTVDAIGKIEKAVKSEGLKMPQAVRDSLNETEAAALRVVTATDRIKRSIDAIPDSKTVQFFLETTGRAPASVTYNAHGGYIDSRIGGPTSDSVPAMLSRGEFVLRAGAVNALRNAIGEAGLWSLNHSDRSMPSFLDSPVPPIAPPSGGGSEPALVGAGAPVINIGEIKADAGIDVQAEVLWALRRAERIKRERS
jgi:hypothetical protein